MFAPMHMFTRMCMSCRCKAITRKHLTDRLLYSMCVSVYCMCSPGGSGIRWIKVCAGRWQRELGRPQITPRLGLRLAVTVPWAHRYSQEQGCKPAYSLNTTANTPTTLYMEESDNEFAMTQTAHYITVALPLCCILKTGQAQGVGTLI